MGSPGGYTKQNDQEDRKSLLDALEDLPLKGFQEIDASPSTGITSLPTPQVEAPHLNLAEVVEPSSQIPQTTSLLYMKFPDPPNAPFIKDMDSFTDGSGEGSFDSIPAGSTDEFGRPIPPVNTFFISQLRDDHDTLKSIEQWREEVYSHTPTALQLDNEDFPPDPSSCSSSSPPSKRPRSLASDDEVRRIRRRAHSDVCQPPIIFMERKRSLPSMGTGYDHQHSHSVPPPAPD
ncbi:hypothetical protein V5O48_003606 [Marasmius crinis-equi]|uniref:Uncharacterized protein n=1 Tax=Marasmius crinis-equi TaxID=585013 RepID=A0ABR3FST1_9AGAR